MGTTDKTGPESREETTTGERLCSTLGGVVVWNVRLRVPREGW